MAREKFYRFLDAIDGKGMATAAPEDQQYPLMVQPGSPLPIFPHSEGLRQRIWWARVRIIPRSKPLATASI